jgi:hypothetical protein
MPIKHSSLWGELTRDPDEISLLLSFFTAGSLANMDKYNPRVEAPGWTVHLGTRLDVNWLYGSSFPFSLQFYSLTDTVYLCLGSILGGHGLLAVFVCIRAGWVFCKHDSPLATARLLRRKSFGIHIFTGLFSRAKADEYCSACGTTGDLRKRCNRGKDLRSPTGTANIWSIPQKGWDRVPLGAWAVRPEIEATEAFPAWTL